MEEVKCPICNKLIAKKEKGRDTKGIYFWCPRCKKNFEIDSVQSNRKE